MGLLFAIAWWAEKADAKGRFTFLNNPYVYALSIAVYCTAWTFYGSVGRAASQGLTFLTTYIGPIMVAPLMWLVVRKIIRICKVQRITNLADFISSRYGKNLSLGGMVTVLAIMGVVPYISIQLKAISNSFSLFTSGSHTVPQQAAGFFFEDTAFYITIVLAAFTILFGARHADATKKSTGLITAIAFESVFKLVAFVLVGAWVTFGVFDGFGHLFGQASATLPNYEQLVALTQNGDTTNWMWLNVLSMLAILLLPRQFYVTVKENRHEQHLKKVMWLFPLYLLLINLFVVPVALGGNLLFAGQQVDADTYLLAIPLANNNGFMAMVTYLGGLSAATSMVIVSTTALGVMLSNNLFMPLIVGSKTVVQRSTASLSKLLIRGRQLAIVLILLAAYLYFTYVGASFPLVSIGLISFVAVAQFAPALLGGLFWKRGNRYGAVAGLLTGFVIWLYCLVLPSVITTGYVPESILTEGPWGIELLKPQALFGATGMNHVVQAFFWSTGFNAIIFVVVSLATRQNSKEINQAEVFVDIFKYSTVYESAIVWKGTAYLKDIKQLISGFLGKTATEEAFNKFYIGQKLDPDSQTADFRVVNFAEKQLAGVVGAASARVLMANIVKEDDISLGEVFDILQESQQFISDNKELRKKSEALQQATQQLQQANEELKRTDLLKDEFISTVTHEMRTPLTSIRALTEILQDNDDLEPDERQHFQDTIIKETLRMDRLINQVLDLEKMASGKLQIPLEPLQPNLVVQEALQTMQQHIADKGITISLQLSPQNPYIEGNKDKLMQVVLNLLSNAVKFCNPAEGIIQISTTLKGSEIELQVADNGNGIAEANQGLIFEPFYQASNQNRKKPVGSGLGLAISKKIIEKHHGTISVANGQPNGASFTVSIPIYKEAYEESFDR